MNAKGMEKLPIAGQTYYRADSILEVHPDSVWAQESLNKHNPSGLPPHKLHLKIGASVMLLRTTGRWTGVNTSHPFYLSSLCRSSLFCLQQSLS